MESSINQLENAVTSDTFVNSEEFRTHWQGHRRVTRRVIEAFPEDKLFTYSVGGMRPFSELFLSIIVLLLLVYFLIIGSGPWSLDKAFEKERK